MTILTQIKFFIDLNTPMSKVFKSKILLSMGYFFKTALQLANNDAMKGIHPIMYICDIIHVFCMILCPWGNLTAQQLS